MINRDKVGTIRREDHADGCSIWQKIKNAYHGEYWLCTWSTAPGNVDFDWPVDAPPIEDVTVVVGSLPGLPVDESRE